MAGFTLLDAVGVRYLLVCETTGVLHLGPKICGYTFTLLLNRSRRESGNGGLLRQSLRVRSRASFLLH